MEAAGTSVCLVIKAVLLSARWAGRSRRLALAQAAKAADDGAGAEADNVMLRDTIELLVEQLACAQRRLKAANIRVPYSPAERLHILWCIHYFGIPRRQIPKHFGVARSTVWRWLRRLQDGIGLCGRKCQASVRRTSEELVRLAWELHERNQEWGRRHIALVLATLGIFLAASTVRNILLRPRPRPEGTPATAAGKPEEKKPRQIVARYPNYVWSADRTRVWRWRIWPTWALVAIDHFSRKVVGRRLLSPGGPQCRLGGRSAGDCFPPSRAAEAHHHRPGRGVHL
jgi:transposase